MDQLAEELSTIELPCKVEEDVINKFFNKDHVVHIGQQQDDAVSTDSTVIRRSSEENTRQVSSLNNAEKEQTEENSENNLTRCFSHNNQSINHQKIAAYRNESSISISTLTTWRIKNSQRCYKTKR